MHICYSIFINTNLNCDTHKENTENTENTENMSDSRIDPRYASFARPYCACCYLKIDTSYMCQGVGGCGQRFCADCIERDDEEKLIFPCSDPNTEPGKRHPHLVEAWEKIRKRVFLETSGLMKLSNNVQENMQLEATRNIRRGEVLCKLPWVATQNGITHEVRVASFLRDNPWVVQILASRVHNPPKKMNEMLLLTTGVEAFSPSASDLQVERQAIQIAMHLLGYSQSCDGVLRSYLFVSLAFCNHSPLYGVDGANIELKFGGLIIGGQKNVKYSNEPKKLDVLVIQDILQGTPITNAYFTDEKSSEQILTLHDFPISEKEKRSWRIVAMLEEATNPMMILDIYNQYVKTNFPHQDIGEIPFFANNVVLLMADNPCLLENSQLMCFMLPYYEWQKNGGLKCEYMNFLKEQKIKSMFETLVNMKSQLTPIFTNMLKQCNIPGKPDCLEMREIEIGWRKTLKMCPEIANKYRQLTTPRVPEISQKLVDDVNALMNSKLPKVGGEQKSDVRAGSSTGFNTTIKAFQLLCHGFISERRLAYRDNPGTRDAFCAEVILLGGSVSFGIITRVKLDPVVAGQVLQLDGLTSEKGRMANGTRVMITSNYASNTDLWTKKLKKLVSEEAPRSESKEMNKIIRKLQSSTLQDKQVRCMCKEVDENNKLVKGGFKGRVKPSNLIDCADSLVSFIPEEGDYSGDGFSVWLRISEKTYHALKSL